MPNLSRGACCLCCRQLPTLLFASSFSLAHKARHEEALGKVLVRDAHTPAANTAGAPCLASYATIADSSQTYTDMGGQTTIRDCHSSDGWRNTGGRMEITGGWIRDSENVRLYYFSPGATHLSPYSKSGTPLRCHDGIMYSRSNLSLCFSRHVDTTSSSSCLQVGQEVTTMVSSND